MKHQIDLTTTPASTNLYERTLGRKNYEFSNHLGNVLVTVSDRKIPHDDYTFSDVGSGTADWNQITDGSTNFYFAGTSQGNYYRTTGADGYVESYTADVLSANDYFAFGAIMPGRTFNPTESRYGFGGHEKVDEISGSGNWYTFGDFGYMPRIGRRPRTEPEFRLFPGISPYAVFNNNPIFYRDPDGRIIDPSPLDPSHQSQFKAIVKTLNSSSLFAAVYNQVHGSPQYFTVSAPSATPWNMYELAVTGGQFKKAEDVTFFGYTYSKTGEKDNPHQILLNKYPSLQTGRTGFNPSAIFEETFHAGQYLFGQRTGISQSALAKETEARVARAYVGYQNKMGQATVENYAIPGYVATFMNNPAVQNYFAALSTGAEITNKMESSFRGAVKGLAKEVYERYSKMQGWTPGEKVEDFIGATPYFDELTKKTNKK